MYNAKSKTTKFVPIFFELQDERFIPEPLSAHTHYLLSSENNYANLYAFLTGRAGVTPGELGSLKTLARTPVKTLRFDVSDMSARQLPLSNLPERNPFFTGRERVLTQLQKALADRGRVMLSGLGGVGKTQTALEYAHQSVLRKVRPRLLGNCGFAGGFALQLFDNFRLIEAARVRGERPNPRR